MFLVICSYHYHHYYYYLCKEKSNSVSQLVHINVMMSVLLIHTIFSKLPCNIGSFSFNKVSMWLELWLCFTASWFISVKLILSTVTVQLETICSMSKCSMLHWAFTFRTICVPLISYIIFMCARSEFRTTVLMMIKESIKHLINWIIPLFCIIPERLSW